MLTLKLALQLTLLLTLLLLSVAARTTGPASATGAASAALAAFAADTHADADTNARAAVATLVGGVAVARRLRITIRMALIVVAGSGECRGGEGHGPEQNCGRRRDAESLQTHLHSPNDL